MITTNHCRGGTRADWTDHGKAVPGAEFIWIGVIGLGILALGERENVEVTQSQVAATIATRVGEDFQKGSPQGGECPTGVGEEVGVGREVRMAAMRWADYLS